MKLKNGNRFRIQCDDPETITFVMKDGTVKKVAVDLNGESHVLSKGESLTFEVSKANPRSLAAVYVFKANEGEWYETEVTGSGGGDVSLDRFEQSPGMTDKQRRYSFNS